MRVISKKTLIAFWQTHKDSEQALKAWYNEAMKANWQTPNEIKLQYKSASVVGNNRIVFNICGNKYRLGALLPLLLCFRLICFLMVLILFIFCLFV